MVRKTRLVRVDARFADFLKERADLKGIPITDLSLRLHNAWEREDLDDIFFPEKRKGRRRGLF